MTEIELELTFLAKEIPNEINGVKPTDLIDIYLPLTAKHPILRIRKMGERYEITKKEPIEGTDSSRQYEHTILLTEAEYDALRSCNGRIVQKNRYKVIISGYRAEVDIFTGDLAGLVVIDFEFENEYDKDNFIPPAVCLKDITQEEWIAGGVLAGKSYKDIIKKLTDAGYKTLAK